MTNNAAVKEPKTRRDMTKAQYTWSEMKRKKAGYLMVFPFLLMFLVFTVVPVVISVLLSFTYFNVLEFPKFIFLDNYARMFLDDELFITALKNTLIFAIATGPLSYIISFFIAWFINELSPKARAFVTFIFYAPSISGTVYLIWALVFQGDMYGYLNGYLMKFGIIDKPIVFFQDVKYIMPLMIIISLWTSLGMSFLSFIAGLQGVDRSLYEAGAIDGIKNRWQELWYITLPQMKPMLMFGAVMAITGSFGFGGIVTALCGNPSKDYAAWTLTHHLSEYMGVRFEYGYASAIAVILFAIMFGSNIFIQKILSKVGQ